MEPLMNGLVKALRQTMAGTVVQDVLQDLGERAAQVDVVGTLTVSLTAAIVSADQWRLLDDQCATDAPALAARTKSVLDREGRATILADLSGADEFLCLAPSGLIPDIRRADVALVRGDQLLVAFQQFEEDHQLEDFDDDFTSVEPDPFGSAIRERITDPLIRDILTTLPLPLIRVLAAVADGAPSAVIQLLGPGSSWLAAQNRLVEVATLPPQLTPLGKRVAQNAQALLGAVETAEDRRSFTMQVLDAVAEERLNGDR
jgi:hypothetical protein